LLIAFSLSAHAQQQSKPARIAYFSASTAASQLSRVEAFKGGLRALGYKDGKEIFIEQRYAEGKLDRAVTLANELVGLKLDIIVTGGPAALARPSKRPKRFPLSWHSIGIL